MTVEVANEEFELLPHPAIYWPRHKIIMVADMHLGKINHFRRSGIPVPTKANDKNIEKIVDLIKEKKPERFICLGDLFHSHYNEAWEWFGQIVSHFPQTTFELVSGNHDILSDLQYQRKGIRVVDRMKLDQFDLTHFPDESCSGYNLCGHLHPGVRLRGKGKQATTLPCFYFGSSQGILPAFGMFTGMARIYPVKGDQVYVVVNEKVISV